MNKRGNSITGLVFLLLLATAILVSGKYSPDTSKIVTIHIDGLDNQAIANKVVEMAHMIEGIQTVVLDENTSLCTFRYDSGKINLEAVEGQLAGLGIKFLPVESVKILDQESRIEHKKFLSIKINAAADQ